MPNKTPALISSISTILLLIIFDILSVFVQMLALNGVSERQGTIAMGVSLLCQGVIAVLAGFFAARLANFIIIKFNWNKILTVALAVMAGVLLGATMSILSVVISIPLAGIR